MNPDNYPSVMLSLNYILEDPSSVLRQPLVNQPYVVGNINAGSLYWIPYSTWIGDKCPITGTGFNCYNGKLKTLPMGYDNQSMSLPTSTYVLDGMKPIPVVS